MDTAGMVEITSEAELRELVGKPIPRVAHKERHKLNAIDRQWLARSPFCLIGTAGPDGACDVSPKGDPPGFTLVLDDRTVVIPDRPGNKRVDGMRNIVANPHVGLLYMVPGRGDTLRISGRARLVCDAPFFEQLIVNGNRPKLAIVVEIDEVFFHCAKAFMRSKLWDPESWDPAALPTRARIAKTVEQPDEPIEALEQYYGASYAQRLY
jgi:hypothetical protein